MSDNYFAPALSTDALAPRADGSPREAVVNQGYPDSLHHRGVRLSPSERAVFVARMLELESLNELRPNDREVVDQRFGSLDDQTLSVVYRLIESAKSRAVNTSRE
ncbi:hypothetical protein [Amycolatopsis thermoflava]|uniref:hypothetical protein n=1 Tax=Amycolatopsis thermoflava TaxID=84480 RepID=UPI003EB6D5CB